MNNLKKVSLLVLTLYIGMACMSMFQVSKVAAAGPWSWKRSEYGVSYATMKLSDNGNADSNTYWNVWYGWWSVNPTLNGYDYGTYFVNHGSGTFYCLFENYDIEYATYHNGDAYQIGAAFYTITPTPTPNHQPTFEDGQW